MVEMLKNTSNIINNSNNKNTDYKNIITTLFGIVFLIHL